MTDMHVAPHLGMIPDCALNRILIPRKTTTRNKNHRTLPNFTCIELAAPFPGTEGAARAGGALMLVPTNQPLLPLLSQFEIQRSCTIRRLPKRLSPPKAGMESILFYSFTPSPSSPWLRRLCWGGEGGRNIRNGWIETPSLPYLPHANQPFLEAHICFASRPDRVSSSEIDQ